MFTYFGDTGAYGDSFETGAFLKGVILNLLDTVWKTDVFEFRQSRKSPLTDNLNAFGENWSPAPRNQLFSVFRKKAVCKTLIIGIVGRY